MNNAKETYIPGALYFTQPEGMYRIKVRTGDTFRVSKSQHTDRTIYGAAQRLCTLHKTEVRMERMVGGVWTPAGGYMPSKSR